MADPTLTMETRPGYRVVTLNRPKQLNSFNMAMHLELRTALDEIEADKSCRALLLTGAGRAFCAGQDLSDLQLSGGESLDLGRTLEQNYNPFLMRLRDLPMPVVCAVNGIAAGGGANVALACDIVLAAKSASFLQAFAKIALAPDCGGTYFLPRLAGDARARGLTMLAEPITAQQAADWGLIWKVVEDAELMNEAHVMCARFATAPTGALAATKRALNVSMSNDLQTQLDLERDVQRGLGRAPDFKEGVSAFLEKRKPVFRGRA